MTTTPAPLRPWTELLEDMKVHGQSVTLNWGEDNNLWECSWITSGKRYTAFSTDASRAVALCWAKAPKP